MTDEFYIGYGAATPPSIATRVRRVVAAIATAAAIVAALAVTLHDRLAPARFDFGRPHPVEGTLRRAPYPELESDGRRRLLVGAGKHGADAALAPIPDGPVRMAATTIARGGVEMLEVVPGTVATGPHAAGATGAGDRAGDPGREVTLTGEIVDSKCFLGVMNPGEGTVHRDCARMCLRGGIPPALLVRGVRGEEALVLLVGRDGGPIGVALAAMAGVLVDVRGRLVRDERGLVLAADVEDYRRVTP